MKLLVVNPSGAGVYYYRTFLPHKNLSDKIDITFKEEIVENEEELFDYDLIHFHTTIVAFEKMPSLFARLKKSGIKVIMDLDDLWEIPKTHHKYAYFKKIGLSESIKQNMRLADALTVTSEYLADKAKVYNRNVHVIENGIDFSEDQFKIKKSDKEKLTYGLITGSSHRNDVELLRGLSNKLFVKYKNDIATLICGFDLRGSEYGYNYLQGEFLEDLKTYNILTNEMVDKIERYNGVIARIKNFPKALVIKYNGAVSGTPYKKPITPQKSVWYFYERILTNDYDNIQDSNYLDFLMRFENKEYFNKNVNHRRIFTKPVNEFASSYNELDISLAPLVNTPFNVCKSNLKQLEAGAFKKPIICSEVYPYTIDGIDGENCFIVPNKKPKLWFKCMQKLIDSEQLRIDMGEKMHEVVKNKYDINVLNEKRLDLYEKLIK